MFVLNHLQSVVTRLGIPGGIAVERRDGASIDGRGNPVRGTLTNFTADPAVIQPASGRDLLRLNEGDRSKETILVHTHAILRTAREASGQEADVVLFTEPTPTGAGILEGRYTVATAADWQQVAGFSRVLAIKQESDVP